MTSLPLTPAREVWGFVTRRYNTSHATVLQVLTLDLWAFVEQRTARFREALVAAEKNLAALRARTPEECQEAFTREGVLLATARVAERTRELDRYDAQRRARLAAREALATWQPQDPAVLMARRGMIDTLDQTLQATLSAPVPSSTLFIDATVEDWHALEIVKAEETLRRNVALFAEEGRKAAEMYTVFRSLHETFPYPRASEAS